jgi:hypothetical protein
MTCPNIQSLLEIIMQFKIPHTNKDRLCDEYCLLAAVFDKTISDTDNDFHKLPCDKQQGGTSSLNSVALVR